MAENEVVRARINGRVKEAAVLGAMGLTVVFIYRKPDADDLETIRLGSHSELGF